jgi:uncharacterized protein (TIGR03435 family)
MPDVTDMDLVREYCARQSEPAFETLVHRHVNLVYSTALRRVGNPAQAEEITQAVFIILARKAARLRPDAVLAAWLHETARYVVASYLRGEIRRRRREQEAYMQSMLQPSSDDSAWEQLTPLLDEAIGRLGTADRNVVALRYFQNKSAQEIAAVLNIGEAAAKKRLARAVEKLRLDFFKRGISVSTTALSGAILTHSIQAAPTALAKSVTAIALAKGATAPISTLTLIKGALKIMAWTKAKTAIVGGAVVLLAAGTTTITVKEIAAHRAEASWRVLNPDPDRAPLLVKILPTKFPNSVDSLNVGSRGDNWVGVGEPVLQIARVAYGWRPGRILFTGIQPTERYDFISTLPRVTGPALQAELKSKLGFVGHREMRDMDVLLLKVRRPNAPGLKPPTNGGKDNMHTGHYYCDNAPISSDSGWYPGIARFLEDYFEMPVIDQTGLTQNFHIDLKWKVMGKPDLDRDSLKQALLDQLGLELVPSNMPVEMLVVEKAGN